VPQVASLMQIHDFLINLKYQSIALIMQSKLDTNVKKFDSGLKQTQVKAIILMLTLRNITKI